MQGAPPGPPGSQLPGWLGPVVQVTTQVGLPTVFAGVLLWFVLTRLGSTLDVIKDQEEVRVKIMAAMQDTLVAALDRQADRFEKAINNNIQANDRVAKDAHIERQAIMDRLLGSPRSRKLEE